MNGSTLNCLHHETDSNKDVLVSTLVVYMLLCMRGKSSQSDISSDICLLHPIQYISRSKQRVLPHPVCDIQQQIVSIEAGEVLQQSCHDTQITAPGKLGCVCAGSRLDAWIQASLLLGQLQPQ